MKRAANPIIDFLRELGCTSSINSVSQLKDFIKKRIGEEELKRILDFIENRHNDSNEAINDKELISEAFYDLKNETFERSLAMTLAFDNKLYREMGPWLSSIKDSLGNLILDVGCDNGVLSCYLARLCPSSHIVSIDRCAKSIEHARMLAKKLSLENIEFKVCSVEDVTETFDTVFVSRVSNENGNWGYIDLEHDYWERAKDVAENLDPIIKQLCKCVNDTGNLIGITRSDFTSEYLGRIVGMAANGMNWEYEKWNYSNCCIGVNNTDIFQCSVFSKAKELPNFHEICMIFLIIKQKMGLDIHAANYRGDNALLMHAVRGGKLINGVRLYSKSEERCCGEMSIWQNWDDETAIWLYGNNNNQDIALSCADISYKEAMESDIQQWVKNFMQSGKINMKNMSMIEMKGF